jgi:hypothetical protein
LRYNPPRPTKGQRRVFDSRLEIPAGFPIEFVALEADTREKRLRNGAAAANPQAAIDAGGGRAREEFGEFNE